MDSDDGEGSSNSEYSSSSEGEVGDSDMQDDNGANDDWDMEQEEDIVFPPLGVIVRSSRHTTLASILRDLYLQVTAALHVVARAKGKRCPHRWSNPAPQGTLGEVMAAYSMLIEGIDSLTGGSSSGEGHCNSSSSSSSRRPALLLLFEDVEAVSNRLLEDLLRLLAEVSTLLPCRLVFLVSPAFSLAQNLGSAATATLEPATFVLCPAHAVFEKLLERLFIDAELPLMVTGKVLRFLRVTFLEYHNSITTFIR